MDEPQSTVSTSFAWTIALACLSIGFLIGTVAVMLLDPSLEKLASVETQNAQLTKDAQRREPLLQRAADEIEKLRNKLNQSAQREENLTLRVSKQRADQILLDQQQEAIERENDALKQELAKTSSQEKPRAATSADQPVRKNPRRKGPFALYDEVPYCGWHSSEVPQLSPQIRTKIIADNELFLEISWRLEVKNLLSKPVKATIELIWLDAEEFILDESYGPIGAFFPGNYTEDFSGTVVIERQKADRLQSLSLKITE